MDNCEGKFRESLTRGAFRFRGLSRLPLARESRELVSLLMDRLNPEEFSVLVGKPPFRFFRLILVFRFV